MVLRVTAWGFVRQHFEGSDITMGKKRSRVILFLKPAIQKELDVALNVYIIGGNLLRVKGIECLMKTEEYVDVSCIPQCERGGWKLNSSCVFSQDPDS